MRVILKQNAEPLLDPSNAALFRRIVGEMINIEMSQQVFRNGVKVETPTKEKYPSFDRPGRRVGIISSNGYLLVTNPVVEKELINKLNEQMELMYQELGMGPMEALLRRRMLNSKSTAGLGIFAQLTTETNIRTWSIGTQKRYKHSFNWGIVTDLDRFLNPLETPVEYQLSSILLDEGLFDLQDDLMLDYNLTAAQLRGLRILNITHSGVGNGVLEAMIAAKNKTIPKEISANYYELCRTEWFLAAFHVRSGRDQMVLSIRLCPKRGAAFEVARHLGVRVEHLNGRTVRIQNIEIPVREIKQLIQSWEGVEAHPKLKDLVCCQQCLTPLYGDAYVTYDQTNAKPGSGLPYCKCCIHADSSLYNDKILARFPTGVKLQSLLEYLPNQDSNYQQILLLAEAGEFVHENRMLRSARYLGVTKSDFVELVQEYGKKPWWKTPMVFACTIVESV